VFTWVAGCSQRQVKSCETQAEAQLWVLGFRSLPITCVSPVSSKLGPVKCKFN
ncbi:hypothetical protein HAX54_012092, partial [Datura stramonium]|nr:hypothetical protein [Datura stramonium]